MGGRPFEKPLAWLHGEIKTPPFTTEGRVHVGFLLRKLQQGEVLSLPDSRPLSQIGKSCHELRVRDGDVDWRLFYAVRPDAIVVLGVEKKGTQRTPKGTIQSCKKRIAAYDRE